MSRYKLGLALVFLLVTVTSVYGCGEAGELNDRVEEITKPYIFGLASWEFEAIGGEVWDFLRGGDITDNATGEVITYFTNSAEIRNLEAAMNAVRMGTFAGDLAQLQSELAALRSQNAARRAAVEKVLEIQVRETLSEQGVFNPLDRYVTVNLGFPPVKIHLGEPPHILVISPRDSIENIKEVDLLPDLSLAEMEEIESGVESLGYSAIVEGLGGLSTYPSFVLDEANLRFTIETIVHEWMHQYLMLTPLGFRYTLDQLGIHSDYDIATINETVAGMIAAEIGAIVYRVYVPQEPEAGGPPSDSGPVFDFNKTMREIRLAVDDLLSRGQVAEAQTFMEQQRQYLAQNGYYIRKLNQAYFAFHGTYADSPTSVSPIGAELRALREQSGSLEAFLDTVTGIQSRDELAEKVD
jgi:hypothetical protein